MAISVRVFKAFAVAISSVNMCCWTSERISSFWMDVAIYNVGLLICHQTRQICTSSLQYSFEERVLSSVWGLDPFIIVWLTHEIVLFYPLLVVSLSFILIHGWSSASDNWTSHSRFDGLRTEMHIHIRGGSTDHQGTWIQWVLVLPLSRYLLQRKNVRLKDFLRVIEYEYTLERRRLKSHTDLKLKKMNDSDYSSNANVCIYSCQAHPSIVG